PAMTPASSHARAWRAECSSCAASTAASAILRTSSRPRRTSRSRSTFSPRHWRAYDGRVASPHRQPAQALTTDGTNPREREKGGLLMRTRRLRRSAMILVAACVVAAAVLGTNVALGSGKSRRVESSKTLKCKAQACVRFDPNGVILGEAVNVVKVDVIGGSLYCVSLAPKHVATPDTIAVATVDYTHSPDQFVLAENRTDVQAVCTANGDPNSVAFQVFAFLGGGWVTAREALTVVVP